MYPKRLILKNFGPFESLDYDFVHKPIAVIGENKTQDDQLSNGSGKSFLGQGLFYSIYGVNLRGNIDKKLIRDGFDTAYLCVHIYCPIRKQTLLIEREIRTKGSSTLRLGLINENESTSQVSFSTVLDGNRYIANWIEISAEDAKSYYIVTKDNYNSFFKSSNTEKLALISRFINFSNIDKTKDIIERENSSINEEKQALERDKSSWMGKLSVYEQQLEEESNVDLEEVRSNKILHIEKEITDLYIEIETTQMSIGFRMVDKENAIKERETLETTISKVEKELTSIDLSEYEQVYKEIDDDLSEIYNQRKDIQNKIDESERGIKKLKSILNSIETALAGIIVCPKCHHEFLLNGDKSVDELKVEQKDTSEEISSKEKDGQKFQKKLDEIYDVINEYKTVREETEQEERKFRKQKQSILLKLSKLEESINQKDKEILSYNKDIDVWKNLVEVDEVRVQEKKKLIEQIKSEVLEKKDLSSYKKNIDIANEKIEKIDNQIINQNSKISKNTQWIQRFKDFKMFLAMEQLKNIQSSANDVLKKMGSDLRLMIEGFKKGANGKIKEEIIPYIFRDEMEFFTFYSEGEKARCEISLILALQSMINTTKKYGGMQFLLIDEVLESVDSLGIESITSSISFLKQSILIVTHVPKLNEDISQIRIVKENGISKLEV